VQPLREKRSGKVMEVRVGETKKQWVIYAPGLEGKEVDIFAENEYITTASVGRKGDVKIRKDKDPGKMLKMAIMRGQRIFVKY
jgi:ATPase